MHSGIKCAAPGRGFGDDECISETTNKSVSLKKLPGSTGCIWGVFAYECTSVHYYALSKCPISYGIDASKSMSENSDCSTTRFKGAGVSDRINAKR
jgi:hypothetical protein